MALNFAGIGKQVALIEGGPMDKQILYCSEEELPEDIPSFTSLSLKKGQFRPIPDKKKNRECHFIAGSSGSGKSYWAREWIGMRNKGKGKKKRPVYVFSSLPSDPTIDKIKPSRIKIGANLIKEPIEPKQLKDSIAVFDDVDVIKPKIMKDKVYDVMDNCLQIGRHHNTDVIMTSHKCTGKDLAVALNECHTITTFPVNFNKQISYLWKEYMGLDSKQIKKVRKLKTRWITFIKGYPNLILTQYQCFIANKIFDDEEEN